MEGMIRELLNTIIKYNKIEDGEVNYIWNKDKKMKITHKLQEVVDTIKAIKRGKYASHGNITTKNVKKTRTLLQNVNYDIQHDTE